MGIKFDLRVPPCAPVTDVARFVSRCEEAGFDGVGILDSQMLERDIFVSMAMAAQATSSIRISSAVLNPVTRHVSVMACSECRLTIALFKAIHRGQSGRLHKGWEF